MKKTISLLLAAGLILLALGAVHRQTATEHEAQQIERQLKDVIQQAGLSPLTVDLALNPAQVALGQALFFDNELSGNRDVSCATCHHPSFGLSDGLALAVGTGGTGSGPERQLGDGRQFVPRNTPDLFNRGLPAWTTMFWDGRVTGSAGAGFTTPAGDFLPAGLDNVLAVQSMMAVTSRHEMRGGLYDIAGYLIQPGDNPADYQPGGTLSQERPLGWSDHDIHGRPNELAAIGNQPEEFPLIWGQLMVRLLALPEYQRLFQAAYPGTPLDDLGFEHAANALAAFQADAFTLVNAPWDRYLAGDDAALSLEAKQGALLFLETAGCARCHSGNLFTDQQYHNIGAPQFGPGTGGSIPLDFGRGAQTGDPSDRYAFRTPSLRNVSMTGPWLHNGAYATLEGVVRHHLDPAAYLAQYAGHNLPPALRATLQNEPVTIRQILQTRSPLLKEIELSNQEVRQLLIFLESLTDPATVELEQIRP